MAKNGGNEVSKGNDKGQAQQPPDNRPQALPPASQKIDEAGTPSRKQRREGLKPDELNAANDK